MCNVDQRILVMEVHHQYNNAALCTGLEEKTAEPNGMWNLYICPSSSFCFTLVSKWYYMPYCKFILNTHLNNIFTKPAGTMISHALISFLNSKFLCLSYCFVNNKFDTCNLYINYIMMANSLVSLHLWRSMWKSCCTKGKTNLFH